jgi:hypothetical protein
MISWQHLSFAGLDAGKLGRLACYAENHAEAKIPLFSGAMVDIMDRVDVVDRVRFFR